jgi:hypothetical protein
MREKGSICFTFPRGVVEDILEEEAFQLKFEGYIRIAMNLKGI